MRLIKKYYFSFIIILSSLLSFSLANTDTENIVSRLENGIGCTGTFNSSTTGFVANVYSLVYSDESNFNYNTWVADSYTTEVLQYSANGVTSPNFSFLYTASLYGYAVETSLMAVELTGYFRGMY